MTQRSNMTAGWFKRLVRELDRPVLVLDAEWRVLTLNPAAERLTGQSARGAAGRFGGDLVGLDRAACESLGFGSGGEERWISFVCVPPGSSSHWVNARGRAMAGNAGERVIVWVLDSVLAGAQDEGLPADAPVVVFDLNREGRLRYGAEHLAKALDADAVEMEGQPFRLAVVEEQREAFDGLWRKTLAGEAVRNAEFRMRRRHGAPRPFWISLFPVRDSRGVPLGARGIAGDLSVQKDLAYALEASEERFSVLFRESSDLILVLTMEGEILMANPAFERFTGVRSDELFSGVKGWGDFVLAGDVQPLHESLRQCAVTQKDGMAEFRVRDAKGAVVWFEQSHSILHDENERPRGIMAVARNIHHHKQHEEALQERAETLLRRHDRAQELIGRLKHFFTQTGLLGPEPEVFLRGVCDVLYEMYQPALVMLCMKDGGPSVYRARPEVIQEVGGEAIAALRCGVCGPINDSGMPFYSNTLADRPPPGCRAELGRLALRTCLGAPLRDATGRVRGSLAILDDKTRAFDSLDVELLTVAALQVASRLRAEEQERLKQDLEEHLRQAQKMEAVGMLAGGIAHDFNNILSSILGFTSYLMAKSPPGSTLQRDLGLIEQSAVRAADLTRQLLAFARRRHFAKEAVSMNGLIEDVLAILKRSLPAHITIQTRLAPDLPRVMGDPGQLNQVIMNLCLNAAEAMAGPGGVLSLETEHRPMDERERARFAAPDAPAAGERYVCIGVSDTGVGIRAEEQARIFDPFYTTKAARGGTGLGLSIVYGIVANHKGHIHVESEVGRGTVFRLYLPACEDAEPPPAAESKGRAPGGTETVLVVDDEPLVRQMAVEVLKAYGYKALSAASGEEAVDLLKTLPGRLDLVFLDLIMPGMDGRRTMEALRAIDPSLRVLLTSGFVQEDLTEQLMEQGALGIVYKPCKSDEMAWAVRRALDRPLDGANG